MSEYVITTDNNSDLPEEYLKDHGVGCMYLSYSMDGKNYTFGLKNISERIVITTVKIGNISKTMDMHLKFH